MRRVTLQTVADEVGVSRMTVSNAFSRPDQLSAGLRDRILAVADRLGYAGPDPAARALARGTSGMVGVVLTDSPRDAFQDEVAVGFLGAIADGISDAGLSMILLNTAPVDGVEPARNTAMDGAIVYSCAEPAATVQMLERRAIPIVMVDGDPRAGISSVNVDDYGGARAAAEHVVALGHRRVAMVGTRTGLMNWGRSRLADNLEDNPANNDVHVARERLRGFRDGLGRWADNARAVGIAEPVYDRVAGRSDNEELVSLLTGPDRPTALLCFSDVLAVGAMSVAVRVGLRVPDELSVVGFDDNPLATRVRPALTTVRQDLQVKGQQATTALLAAMQATREGRKPRVRRALLPAELIVRDSTAPAQH